MTREEAIAKFEKQLTSAMVVLDSGFGTRPGESDRLYRERKELAEIALSALRAQQEVESKLKVVESNKPLTLDELRKMDGEPVFLVDLVHKSDPKVPDLWGGWIVFTKHDQNGFIPRGGGFFSNDGYGKNWLAYRQKPEEGTR